MSYNGKSPGVQPRTVAFTLLCLRLIYTRQRQKVGCVQTVMSKSKEGFKEK